MSVSDAAPLPRLGEVFFDVRGNSRSMRLSWYADTGVAVFSIWQAGMCTGTFRLPMADLSRMIEILERGPAPRSRGPARVSASRQGEDRRSDSDWYYESGTDEPAGYGPDHAAGYGADHPGGYGPDHAAGYGADHPGGHGQSGYAGDYEPAGYGAPDGADEPYDGGSYGSPGRSGAEDYRTQAYPAGYGRREHHDDGEYHDGYGSADYGADGRAAEADYLTGEYPGYQDERRASSDRSYPPGNYDDRQDYRAGGHRRDDSGFPRGAGSPPGGENDFPPYHEDRPMTSHEAGGAEPYRNDNRAPGGHRGDNGEAAYPADRRSVSPTDRYPGPSAAEEAYSYGAEYRYR